MPEAVERLDDRTFFILYALSKKSEFVLPNVRFLYNLAQDNVQYVLNELQKLHKSGHINVALSMTYPHSNAEYLCEKLASYQTDIEQMIAAMNANIESGEDIMSGVGLLCPFLEYLPDVLNVRFVVRDDKKEEFLQCFEAYFKCQMPVKRIYTDAEHYAVVRKYFKSKDGESMKVNPKTKLSRYTESIDNYERYAVRYNFWHFFKEQEDKDIIQTNNLFIDEEEPTIDYLVKNERMFFVRKIKEDEYIDRYSYLDLYKNKIINIRTSKTVGIERLYMFNLLKYALDNPTGLEPVSADTLARQCGKFKCENIRTATSAVNRIIQKVIDCDDFVLIKPFTRYRGENRFKICELDDFQQ